MSCVSQNFKKASLAQHFKQYFKIIRADTEQLKNIVFKIRYEVYAKELKYEQNCPIDNEHDEFDDYSQFVLIQHISTGIYAGCVRLVMPPKENSLLLLPFEKYCLNSVEADKLKAITDHGRTHIGEISRLAVLASFRRRKGESSNPYGVNIEHDLSSVSEHEMRLFPFIAIALYLASTVIAIENQRNHVVVMMEPRLARLLKRYGIFSHQIGEIMQYHGQRAMFSLDKNTFFEKLKPELYEFYQMVKKDLKF